MSLTATRGERRPRTGPGVPHLGVAVAALTLLAAALRLYRLGFGYAHPVTEYDGGVYLASALALVDGRLPYRDYVFVQPPGITLLLAPVAVLGKVIGSAQAMGLARVLTGLAGSASVPLGAVILRHRGSAVTVAGCAVLALQSDAVAAAWSPLLEPWLVLCCLGAAAAAFAGDEMAGPRRLSVAGLLLGLACAIKIWAVAPALVLFVVCVRARRGRPFAAGVVVGSLVPLAPFVLAAPGPFWRQVVVDQLTRSAPTRTTLAFRLVHVFASGPPTASEASPIWPLLVGVAVLVLALITLPWLRRRPGTPLELFASGSAVLVVALLLTPDTFYWHYAAFSTPFLVLAGLLRVPAARGRQLALGAVSVAVLALAVVVVQRYARPTHPYDNHRALQAVIPRGSCLVSSDPSATIAADRFPTSASCPLLLDPFGVILAATGGAAPSATTVRRPAVTTVWLAAYRHADFVYLQTRVTPQFPTDGPAQAYLNRHFRRLPLAGPGRLYARVGAGKP